MKTVSMKTKAWISRHSSLSPSHLIQGERLDDLNFASHDMTRSGWTYVGEAELTVQMPDAKTLIGNKVQALREEAKSIRAEATAQATRIESQIQSLLAITCDSALVTTGAAGDIEPL